MTKGLTQIQKNREIWVRKAAATPSSPPTSRGSETTTATGGKSTTARSPTASSSAPSDVPSAGVGLSSSGVNVVSRGAGDGATSSGPRKFMSIANLKERRPGLMRKERSFPSLIFWRKRDARKQRE
jgi:hypothetical protein